MSAPVFDLPVVSGIATEANLEAQVNAGFTALYNGTVAEAAARAAAVAAEASARISAVAAEEAARIAADAALEARADTLEGSVVGIADSVAGAQPVVNVSPPFSQSEWVGPVAGEHVIYGADLRDGGRFVGREIEAARTESFAVIPDYVGAGWRHVEMNILGQVLRYIDADGVVWRWDAARNGYTDNDNPSQVQNIAPANMPVSWLHEEEMEIFRQRTLADLGYVAPVISPTTPPAEAAQPPVLSFDAETYGTYVSQQIPSIERVGQRLFRAEYGGKDISPGGNGELAPCYVRLNFSDDGGATWTRFAFFVPSSAERGILDPHVQRMHDGRLLVVMPSSGSARRTVWGCILNNPLTGDTDAGGWDFGPICFLDYGFVGRPRPHGRELRYTANEPAETEGRAAWQNAKYCRLVVTGDVVKSEFISALPPTNPLSDWSFQETSVVPYGKCSVLAVFRTKAGWHECRSHDDGLTWSAPVRMPGGVGGAVSRADLFRLPSGRLAFLHNQTTRARRENMAISLSEDDGRTWPVTYIYDPRGGDVPRVSYPSGTWGAAQNGRYNGIIYAVHDRGRGTVEDPANPGTYFNDLITCVLDEDEIWAGNGSVTLYTEGL